MVLETGSNQALVFGTNKQRLNVAASRLIWQVGFEWIPEAIDEVRVALGESIDHVVKASGLGVMLASEDAGRRVIEIVTRRAVLHAPDLQIWGVVGAAELTADTLNAALAAAQRDSHRHRADRCSVLTRDLNLPYTQLCAYTGRPAVTTVIEGREGDTVARPVSAGVHEFWSQARNARKSLVNRLQAAVSDAEDRAVLDRAVVSRSALESGDGVSAKGWVAVLHADGNGIGEIFANLRHCYTGSELIDRMRSVSEALESAAWAGVARAIVTVGRTAGSGWVLPILVGGDDITVLLDGRYGFAFTTALAAELEVLLEQDIVTTTLARVRAVQGSSGGEVTAPRRVTVAAGLVFTKPHHPFSHGVELAEKLTRCAKTVKVFEVSALDTVVLYESAVRELDAIRADLRTAAGVPLWAGPIILGTAPPELAHRGVDRLWEAMSLLAVGGDTETTPDLVPSGVVHDLRGVLTAPHPDDARLRAVEDRARVLGAERGYSPALTRLLDDHLFVDAPDGRFSRLLTAMELADVGTGTGAIG
ncbi:Cas10/Cmr2 second palm domain-containing protein [Nocardia fluminea]|uniref:Cas10/Cmr2 second palm domain-containing protein n=1 Tax=Nocardia fluminea TaxID=134984 RepID=UPI000C71007A|nr:hypothetical protein [Nocardia fluminea]